MMKKTTISILMILSLILGAGLATGTAEAKTAVKQVAHKKIAKAKKTHKKVVLHKKSAQKFVKKAKILDNSLIDPNNPPGGR